MNFYFSDCPLSFLIWKQNYHITSISNTTRVCFTRDELQLVACFVRQTITSNVCDLGRTPKSIVMPITMVKLYNSLFRGRTNSSVKPKFREDLNYFLLFFLSYLNFQLLTNLLIRFSSI